MQSSCRPRLEVPSGAAGGPMERGAASPYGCGAPTLPDGRADALRPRSHGMREPMDLDFSPQDIAFREEVRTFIAENYPQSLREKQKNEETLGKEDYFSWHRILAKKGWATPSWPVEWGGTGWTPTQKYIWSEEQAFADTIALLPFGGSMLAPVIWTFATQEQKERFLPGIRDGIDWWCQGYSEPGAGSDLASLKTRAERRGADYVVNGQKTWTSFAHWANWIFCLVRTRATGKPQGGISFLLIA